MAAHVPSRLYRSRSQKMIAGVCGGLGEYFDVDPVLIRLMFVVTTFISGAGILAYIILWIVVPFEGDSTARMDALKRDFDDLTGRVREYIDPPRGGAAPEGAGAAGRTGGPQGGPDVTGYHGGFGGDPYGQGAYGQGAYGPGSHAASQAAGPFGPGPHGPGFGAPAAGPSAGTAPDADPNVRGGPPSAASPFDTSRDASMTSDTATARVPGSDAPTADPTGPRAAEPAPPPAGEERADGPERAASDAAPSAAATADDDPFRIDPPAGTPPFGTPGGGQPGPQANTDPGAQAGAGMPPFGSPYGTQPGTPPSGAPFGAAAGGAASAYGWTSAPRDGGSSTGSSSGSPFSPPAATPSDRKRRRQHWAGAILILVGTLILANNLGLLWWLEFEYFMPLVLVGVGAWLLFGRGRRG